MWFGLHRPKCKSRNQGVYILFSVTLSLCHRIVNLSGTAIWGERTNKGKKSNQLVAKVVKKQKERPVSRFDDDAQRE